MSALSIILPCYNEGSRMPIREFADAIGNLNNNYKVIFVNDGSKDNTITLLQEFKSQFADKVVIVDLKENVGKAEAIRKGFDFLVSQGSMDPIVYLDADLATPFDAIFDFENVMNTNNELFFVLGSRIKRMGSSIDRNPNRHYFGRVFATVASLILRLPIYDTQCGGKLMKMETAKVVFKEKFISRWLFDVEILARCLSHYGYSRVMSGVYEHPLTEWREVGESKIRFKDFIKVPLELMKIYFKYNSSIKSSMKL